MNSAIARFPRKYGGYVALEPYGDEPRIALAHAQGRTEVRLLRMPDPSDRLPLPEVGRLTHPGLWSILERNAHGPEPFQAEEFVFGLPLDQVLQRIRQAKASVPPSVARAWAETLLSACVFLERQSAELRLYLAPGSLRARAVHVSLMGAVRLTDYVPRVAPIGAAPRGSAASKTRRKHAREEVRAAGRLMDAIVARCVQTTERDALLAAIAASSEEQGSLSALQFSLRGPLSALGAPAEKSEAAAFLAPFLDDVAEAARARMARLQELAATDVPSGVDWPEEGEVQPSVVTMPGSVATASRGARWPARAVAVSAAAVAGGLWLLKWFMN